MALQRPKERPDSNLSLLIQAIAQAYHRGTNGEPKYQPISFKTGISNAAIHLWKNSAVQRVRSDYLNTLAETYRLDFPKVLAFVYGPPSKLRDDALLALLRPGDDDGKGARARKLRPISGGSDAPVTRAVVDVLEKIADSVSYRTLRRWLAAWRLLGILPVWSPA